MTSNNEKPLPLFNSVFVFSFKGVNFPFSLNLLKEEFIVLKHSTFRTQNLLVDLKTSFY